MPRNLRRAGLPLLPVLLMMLGLAAPVAAQEVEGPPFVAEEVDTGFFYLFDGEGTLHWSIHEFETQEEFEAQCVEGDGTDERCASASGEVDEHGDVVSLFTTANPEEERTPGFGCLVAEVAQGEHGLRESEQDGTFEKPEDTGCPTWLYPWLQTFADRDGEDPGPPEWVPVPDQARQQGENGEDPGPPFGIPGGPPSGTPGGRP